MLKPKKIRSFLVALALLLSGCTGKLAQSPSPSVLPNIGANHYVPGDEPPISDSETGPVLPAISEFPTITAPEPAVIQYTGTSN
jgi:PBP1b-binding outer membrane lipoprotein LpoB